jgi:hypothetical protein
LSKKHALHRDSLLARDSVNSENFAQHAKSLPYAGEAKRWYGAKAEKRKPISLKIHNRRNGIVNAMCPFDARGGGSGPTAHQRPLSNRCKLLMAILVGGNAGKKPQETPHAQAHDRPRSQADSGATPDAAE